MKIICLFTLLIAYASAAQEKTPEKKFDNIALVNKIAFVNAAYDQPKSGCGFLVKYQNDTFAVTAKHLLQAIHPPEMKTVLFENIVKNWSLYSLDKKQEPVTTYKLINENNTESLDDQSIYGNDFLVFSLKENHSTVKALEPRLTPLDPREKVYVVGWTRGMEDGPQHVYEFEYRKTTGHRILLEERPVPQQLDGLSGAPLVDENGLLVGWFSNATIDPVNGRKYFSACPVEHLLEALKTEKKE